MSSIEVLQKRRATTAAWKLANAAKVKESSRQYYAANKDKITEANLIWSANNQEKRKAVCKKYREANAEKCKLAVRKSMTANPSVGRLAVQNRRAKKRANGGVLSKGLAEKLFKLQRGKCPCCGLPLGDNYHLDHKMPIDLGGPNIDSNIQLLRQRCNAQKHSKHPIDFMQERGFLL